MADVFDRVRKLEALAVDPGATGAERALALAKARELREKHGIGEGAGKVHVSVRADGTMGVTVRVGRRRKRR